VVRTVAARNLVEMLVSSEAIELTERGRDALVKTLAKRTPQKTGAGPTVRR
jgi:hypothetical protein